MAERSGYADGEPCWADVTTPDLEAGKRFYGAVFGWEFQDTGPDFGHYTMALKDGKEVAAVTPPAPGTDSGVPPAWSTYLASSDAGATAARVEANGGKIIMGPMEIPGSGHMLVGFDPSGAPFGVWQPGGHMGSKLFGEPGALSWAEINTRDGAAADGFYQALFGYQQQQIGDGDTFDYTLWTVDGRQVCGRQKMGADFPAAVPPHWMPYFGVDDADAAIQRITDAGGQVRMGPFDSPYGRVAVIADPHGAVFSIIDESRRSQQPG